MSEAQTASLDCESIIKSVKDLFNEKFFIPKYQRGYRWTKPLVTDLLEDVNAFTAVTKEIDDRQQTTWYCFQPLVVKQNGRKWNLIDGQQRLTTIYLILCYLREGLAERRRQEAPLYSLEYETRKGTGDWTEVLDDEIKAEANIDFWHIHNAYQTIKKWFSDNKATVDEDKFRGKLSDDCKFIWYDIGQTGHGTASEQEVFIRLNVGKIPLTNSELIKALFLNRSNFKSKAEDEIRLRQLEIATQWDAMEEELSNNAFWYFINGKENLTYPRINYLFEIISKKKASDSDAYATFRFFNRRFKEKDNVAEQWQHIYEKYQILREWFSDRFYYHRIGYLLTFGQSLSTLLDGYTQKTKTDFKHDMSKRITGTIKWDGNNELEYDENKDQIKKILLLHNVITMADHENDDARFPFDKYHTEQWDIEHIQAVADPEKKPPKPEARKEYLEDAAKFVSDETLKAEIKTFAADANSLNNIDSFNKLYGNVVLHFMDEGKESSDTNTLSNLALLDTHTNRGYGNDVFPVKREKILHKDGTGQFIPVCTRNVFLKYYTSQSTGDLTRWRMADRKAYLENIKTKFEQFLTIEGAK